MQLPRGGDGCYTKIRSAYGKWAMYPFTLARYAVRRSSPTLKNHPRGLGTMRHNGASCGAVIAPYPYTHHILTENKQPSPAVPNVSLPPTHPPPKCNHPIPIWTHEANLGTRHVDGPVEVILGHQPTCRSRAPSTSTSIPPPHPAISPAPGTRTHSPLGCGCGMIADSESITHSLTYTHSLARSFIHSCATEKPSSQTNSMHPKLQQ